MLKQKNIKKYKTLFFLILILGLSLYKYFQQYIYKNSNISEEQEQSSISEFQPVNYSYPHEIEILNNRGFTVGYDKERNNPAWVSYRLHQTNELSSYLKERPNFTEDKRIKNPVDYKDYKNSGYDRGHMAPNYAISRLYGIEAQKETFLMTNILPQKHALNSGLWNKLEIKEFDDYRQKYKEVFVLVGPIYAQEIPDRFFRKNNIEIPDYFFKILFVKRNNNLDSLAFIFPQELKNKAKLKDYLVSIDEIEEKTGFDFFSKLDDESEEKLESKKMSNIW